MKIGLCLDMLGLCCNRDHNPSFICDIGESCLQKRSESFGLVSRPGLSLGPIVDSLVHALELMMDLHPTPESLHGNLLRVELLEVSLDQGLHSISHRVHRMENVEEPRVSR